MILTHIVIGEQEFGFQQAKVASDASTGRLGSCTEATLQVHRTVHRYCVVTCGYGTRILRTMERLCPTVKNDAHTAGWRILILTTRLKQATTRMSGTHGVLAHPHSDKYSTEALDLCPNIYFWYNWPCCVDANPTCCIALEAQEFVVSDARHKPHGLHTLLQSGVHNAVGRA